MLFAEGKESTEITVSESTGSSSSSSSNTTTRTYSETNTFYSEDISHLLQKSVSSNIFEDGTLEILPQNKEIAFEFVLPNDNNLLSSYKGRHANITYTVKATADIAKRLDVNKEEHFSVFNPNNNKVVSPSVSEENIKTVTVADAVEDKNNLPSSLPKEEDASKGSYSSRFERIFGKKSNRTTTPYSSPPRYFTFGGTGLNINLGSIFAKNREHFLKENSKARIELLNSNTPYSSGHIVKGKLILTQNLEKEEEEKKKVRGMKITLLGIEHAFAQGLQRVTTIEKYEIHMESAENGEYNDNSSTIPFEFQIPAKVNQSYAGKYSEYFWGIETKLNIAWSSDINARTIIEID
jgi:hypothetical protein